MCVIVLQIMLTRKHWKFEAVTNMAIASPLFWSVQSRSLSEVYRLYRGVVVTCC